MTRWSRRITTALAALSASSAPAQTAKEVLNERTEKLIGQGWCQELLRIEKVSKESVRREYETIFNSLQSTSDLMRLAELFETKHKNLQLYNTVSTTEKIAWVSIAIVSTLSGIACFVILDMPPWWGAVVSLYLVSMTLWIPSLLRERRRRKEELTNAPAEFSQTTTDLDRRLRSVLEKSTRLAARPSFDLPTNDTISIEEGPGLSSRVSKSRRISTKSRPLIEDHLLRIGGAAVGVTGERGIGKSEVLRFFSDDPASQATVEDGGTIGVFVAVPAAFKSLEFLRLVLRRLAEAVPGEDILHKRSVRKNTLIFFLLYATGLLLILFGFFSWLDERPASYILELLGSGSSSKWQWTSTHLWLAFLFAGLGLTIVSMRFPSSAGKEKVNAWRVIESPSSVNKNLKPERLNITSDAAELITRLRYAETVSSQSEGSVSLGKLSAKRTRQRSLSTLPLTEADLIDEFRKFAEELERVGYRVIISVDEMDKLEEGPATEEFLNSVKQLFSIRSCSFLVSVSSSAWSQFVRRGIDMRNALDSSLDAIEMIQPLDFLESRSLLLHREEMSDSQILLCHVSAGGLPREVLRYARILGWINHERGGAQSLAEVAMHVINHEFFQLIQGSLQQLSAWKPPIGQAVAVELNKLVNKWCNGSTKERGLRPPEFAGLQRKLPLQDEAENFLSCLELHVRFLLAVRGSFCDPWESSSHDWATEALMLGEKLAAIRRELERNPTDAQVRLEKVEREINDLRSGTVLHHEHTATQRSA